MLYNSQQLVFITGPPGELRLSPVVCKERKAEVEEGREENGGFVELTVP